MSLAINENMFGGGCSDFDEHKVNLGTQSGEHGEPSVPRWLILKAKQRDDSALNALFRICTPFVYRWAARARIQESDAADVVQEVFRAVLKGIEKFESGAKSPPFLAWLWGIARYKILDHFRNLKRHPRAFGGDDSNHRFVQSFEESSRDDSEHEVDNRNQGLVRRAMATMKTDFRESTWQAFWLVTVECQAASEVASRLGISVSSVYTAKSRVLSRLRTELKADETVGEHFGGNRCARI